MLTDIAIVEGLQSRSRRVEEQFYREMKSYYMRTFNRVFFDVSQKESIFQDSVIRLWTQIENGTISVRDGRVGRLQKDGTWQMMTCSLKTYLFAIAQNEYREVLRQTQSAYIDDCFAEPFEIADADDDDERERLLRLVDEELLQLSPHCVEILTLFYVQNLSLDEILLLRQDKNTSKEGLKTSKYKCMNHLRERINAQMK